MLECETERGATLEMFENVQFLESCFVFVLYGAMVEVIFPPSPRLFLLSDRGSPTTAKYVTGVLMVGI